MKQIQPQLSGWKPSADDLMQLQNGVTESLMHLNKGLLPFIEQGYPSSGYPLGGFKLWGCVMTVSGGGLTLTWTEGAIYLQGRILAVASGTVNRPSGSAWTWRFEVQESWGQSEYQSGPMQDTRLTSTATLVAYQNVLINLVTYYDCPYLYEVITGKVVSLPSASGLFGADTGCAWLVAPSNVEIRYSRAINNLVSLNFCVNTSTVTGSTIWVGWTLPDAIGTALGSAHGSCIVNGDAARFELIDGTNVLKIYKLDGSAMSSTILVKGSIQFYVQ